MEIIVTMENQEKAYDLENLGLNFDSTSDEILAALQPVILEEFGVNIKDEDRYIYTVKKITSPEQKLYAFPKSPAGK